MRQIFLSYNSADKQLASRIKTLLHNEDRANRVHLSSDRHRGPDVGDDWRAWIRNTIRSSDLFLLLLSRGSTASAWCNAEIGMALLLDKPILSFKADADVEPHPLLDGIQTWPLGDTAEDVLRLVERFAPRTASGPPVKARKPYPGLRPLTDDDEGLLFGRTAIQRRIIEDLDSASVPPPKLIVVTGGSGSGKSSLIRSGVVPALRRSGWNIGEPTQPQVLAQGGVERHNGGAFDLLVLDQAEELLVVGDHARSHITAWLARWVDSGGTLIVVVRSEFRDRIAAMLPQSVEVTDHYVGYLNRGGLEAAIRGPAKQFQLQVDDQLVSALVDDAGSGTALPLLAYTLDLLWQKRDRRTNTLLAETFLEIGGVEGVLASRATQALRNATGGDQSRRTDVLNTLTQLASPTTNPPTRRPVLERHLSDVERFDLEHFRARGVIVKRTSYSLTDEVDAGFRPMGDDLVDVASEALFDWPPLRSAIEEQRERNTVRQRIERDAEDWDEGGRVDKTQLLTADRLADAKSFNWGSPIVEEFIAKSTERDRRLRWFRAGVIIISVAAITASVGIVWALSERQRANDEASAATAAEKLAEDRRLDAVAAETAAQSLRRTALSQAAIDGDRDFAMLAAAGAYRTDAGLEAESALLASLATPSGPERYYVQPDGKEVVWPTAAAATATELILDTEAQGPAILNLQTGRLRPVAVDLSALSDIRFGPAVTSETAAVRAIDADTGIDVVGLIDLGSGLLTSIQHEQQVTAAHAGFRKAFFGDADGSLHIVAAGPTSASKLTIAELGGPVLDIDVGPFERWLAATTPAGLWVFRSVDDRWVLVHSLANEEVRGSERVTFGFNGRLSLYASGSDTRVRHWSVEGDEVRRQADLGKHPGLVTALAVIEDGNAVVTAGEDGFMQRWDAVVGGSTGPLASAGSQAIDHLIPQHDGGFVAVEHDRAIRWDLQEHRVVAAEGILPRSFDGNSFRGLIGGEGPVAAITVDDRVLVDNGEARPAPTNAWRGWWVGQALVFERKTAGLQPNSVELIQMNGEREMILRDLLDAVTVTDCYAATASNDSVSFISLAQLQPIDVCAPPPPPLVLEPGPRGNIAVLSISPTGQQIAVIGSSGSIEGYSLETGERIFERRAGAQVRPTAAIWVDEDHLVVGYDAGGPTEIHNVADRDVLPIPLDLHRDAVHWLTVDETRGRVFSAGEDGLIHQVDAATGEVVGGSLVGVRSAQRNDVEAMIRGIRLVGDRTLIVVHGFSIHAWELSPDALLDRACLFAGRRLSEEELIRLDLSPEEQPC